MHLPGCRAWCGDRKCVLLYSLCRSTTVHISVGLKGKYYTSRKIDDIKINILKIHRTFRSAYLQLFTLWNNSWHLKFVHVYIFERLYALIEFHNDLCEYSAYHTEPSIDVNHEGNMVTCDKQEIQFNIKCKSNTFLTGMYFHSNFYRQ